MLRIKVDGARASVAPLWARDSTLDLYLATAMYHEGHLYGVHAPSGSTGRRATLRCVDAQTGYVKWKKSGFGWATLLLAGRRLLILSESGVLAMAEASPDAYVELGRVKLLEGRTWTPPSIANGRLYARNESEVVCLAIE